MVQEERRGSEEKTKSFFWRLQLWISFFALWVLLTYLTPDLQDWRFVGLGLFNHIFWNSGGNVRSRFCSWNSDEMPFWNLPIVLGCFDTSCLGLLSEPEAGSRRQLPSDKCRAMTYSSTRVGNIFHTVATKSCLIQRLNNHVLPSFFFSFFLFLQTNGFVFCKSSWC